MLLRPPRSAPPVRSLFRAAFIQPGGRLPFSTTHRIYSQGRPSTPPQDSSKDAAAQGSPPERPPSTSSLLASTDPSQNSLLSPVHIPEDPNAILKSQHPATSILEQSGLVVQRQLEMMNLFLGFEQANRYVIMDPHGNHVGYMAEHDGGFGKTMGRQWFKTHRAFTTHVFDKHQKEVLRFHRPFSWINSSIKVYDPLHLNPSISRTESSSTDLSTIPQGDAEGRHISPVPLDAMRIIGEAQSQWAPLRRKYNLFLAHDPSLKQEDQEATEAYMQFAKVDEPVLSWDFSLRGSNNRLLGSVNRSFSGFAREIFTDTGVYALRMDSAALAEEYERSQATISDETSKVQKTYAEVVGGGENAVGMTLDQRAVMLATAVTVDFDYFSRHSHGGGMMGYMPLWIYGGGEGAAAEVGAAEAGIAGTEGAGGAVTGAGRTAGVAAEDGDIAGAGTMVGYEAMQRAGGRGGENTPQSPDSPQHPVDTQSPQNAYGDPQPPPDSSGQDPNDAWGFDEQDPWQPGKDDGSGGDGGGGGDGGSWLGNFFDDL